MTQYQQPRNTRTESVTSLSRFRAGKLAPAYISYVGQSEGGMLSHSITLELDPIPGKLLSPVWADVYTLFVPLQAIDALDNPEAEYAGNTEILRDKLLTGNPLFGMEGETPISKKADVVPRKLAGQLRVDRSVRLSYLAAVNHLRRKRYWKATLLNSTVTAISPALVSMSLLERFNGALDPDEHINGSVELDLPDMVLPVEGIGLRFDTMSETTSPDYYDHTLQPFTGYPTSGSNAGFKTKMIEDPTADSMEPADLRKVVDINAIFENQSAGRISTLDFYQSELMDRMTRKMREILDANPEYGQEYILRWAHGLSIETGKVPIVLAERTYQFGRNIVGAVDTNGIEQEIMRSDMAVQANISVPVPKTELGGMIVTLVSVRPDETLPSQPHPFLARQRRSILFTGDELALEPQPVYFRDLSANVPTAKEKHIAFWTGLNALKQNYIHYGYARDLDRKSVEHKTAVWQLKVPLSETPDNIIYPENLSHYPFADQRAEVVTCTSATQLTLKTPLIFGPAPVERLPIIEDAQLFDEE